MQLTTQKRNSKKTAKENAAIKTLCNRHELLKNEEDFFVQKSDGSVVSPIVVVNEQFNTSAQYEETIKNKKDCIFQTTLKINGILKAVGLGYNAKISKIQAAFRYCSENSLSDLGKNMSKMKLRSSPEHQTDNNFGNGSFAAIKPENIEIPSYNDDSYSITGKKVCLALVISEFDDKQRNRLNAKNDYQRAKEVLQRRKFEVIPLVGRVTKNEFNKKLKEIQKRTDIGLFMLMVSSHGDQNDNVMFSDNSDWDEKTGKNRSFFGL